MKIRLLLIITIPILLHILVPRINADFNSGISLSPTSTDFKVKTGQEYRGRFTLKNNELSDLEVEFKEGTIDNGIIINETDLDWFRIDNSDKFIKANSELLVNYTLKVPENVESGSYFKAIVVKFIDSEQTSTSFNLAIQFSVNIYVESLFNNVLGTTITELNSTDKLIFQNKIDLNLVISNASKSNYSKPLINITIINPVGRIVYTSVLNESLSILKDSNNYVINARWPNTDILDLGQYTAQVLVTDTITNKSSVQKYTFFNLNYVYIILIIFVLIAYILLIKFVRGLIQIIRVNKDETNSDSKYIGLKKESKKRASK